MYEYTPPSAAQAQPSYASRRPRRRPRGGAPGAMLLVVVACAASGPACAATHGARSDALANRNGVLLTVHVVPHQARHAHVGRAFVGRDARALQVEDASVTHAMRVKPMKRELSGLGVDTVAPGVHLPGCVHPLRIL